MENKGGKEKSPSTTTPAKPTEELPVAKPPPEKTVKSSEESKNRGWPKGKKRYPKSPGAPKQPLSGYVHFLNDRRETVRKENPDLSFADISKKLAVEWGQVDAKAKQEYAERAEADKERYNKAFAAYQLTDEYKQFIESQKKKENESGGSGPNMKRPAKEPNSASSKKKKMAASTAKENSKYASSSKPFSSDKNTTASSSRLTDTAASGAGNKSLVSVPNTQNNTFKVRKDMPYMFPGSTPTTTDIPIFREEFLEHNKAREAELKQLRKQANEFEEQNAILQKHVENMRSAIGKLEQETTQQQENNAALAKHLDAMRRLVITHFQGVTLPLCDGSQNPINTTTNSKEEFKLTMENVDDFMARLRAIVYEKSNENEQLLVKVRAIANELDYSHLSLES